MARLLFLLAFVLFAGCAASRPSSSSPMSSGERLYRANCASCHALRNPQNYSDEEWDVNVAKYGGKLALSEDKLQAILYYLQSAN